MNSMISWQRRCRAVMDCVYMSGRFHDAKQDVKILFDSTLISISNRIMIIS